MAEPENSFGYIEVNGFVAAVCAADAMGKAAYVTLSFRHTPGKGRVVVMVEGGLASCLAAIEAGEAVARSLNGFVHAHVLARPSEDSQMLWSKLIPESRSRLTGMNQATPAPAKRKSRIRKEKTPEKE